MVYGLLNPPKPTLTVEVANATMMEGAASLPAFTSWVIGLLSGDAIGTTLTINYSTTATTSSAPGTYPITVTVSGSSASKYKIVVDPGTLTITPGRCQLLHRLRGLDSCLERGRGLVRR